MSSRKSASFKTYLAKKEKKRKNLPSWVVAKTKRKVTQKNQKKHWRKNKI